MRKNPTTKKKRLGCLWICIRNQFVSHNEQRLITVEYSVWKAATHFYCSCTDRGEFCSISHMLAFKTWQKKSKHLILHSLARTGEKQLPGMPLMLKTCLSQALQPLLLCCRKQTLEGNSHNSRFQPAGNFARKQLSNGNKACLSKQRWAGKQGG